MSGSSRFTPSRLVFGLVILVVGGVLLAGNLGLDVPRGVWHYWPFLLLGLGAAKLAWPAKRSDRRGGYWLIVVGLYGWINEFRLFGLDWGSSWPIFLIAVGALIAFEGLGGRTDRDPGGDRGA